MLWCVFTYLGGIGSLETAMEDCPQTKQEDSLEVQELPSVYIYIRTCMYIRTYMCIRHFEAAFQHCDIRTYVSQGCFVKSKLQASQV